MQTNILVMGAKKLNHQKATGKGGHHLWLFDPLNTPFMVPEDGSATHLTQMGSAGLKGLLAIETVILSGGNTFHFKLYRRNLKAECVSIARNNC